METRKEREVRGETKRERIGERERARVGEKERERESERERFRKGGEGKLGRERSDQGRGEGSSNGQSVRGKRGIERKEKATVIQNILLVPLFSLLSSESCF